MASAYELRPLTLGELLDHAFTVFRHHFVLLTGITFVARVAPLVTNACVAFASVPAVRVSPGLYGLAILNYVLTYAGALLSLAASVFAISALYLGEDVTIGQAFTRTRGSLLRLLWLAILMVLGAVGTLLVCLVPGFVAARHGPTIASAWVMGLGVLGWTVLVVVFAIRWSISSPALLLEGLVPSAALRRSSQLVAGHAGSAFAIGAIVVVLIVAATMIATLPFQVALVAGFSHGHYSRGLQVLSSLAVSASNIAVTPFINVITCLFYYDLRIRKEGFDLENLMRHMDAAVPAAAPPLA